MPVKPTAVDLCKGVPQANFDPEKSDFLHGRHTSKLFFGDFKGVKVRGCEACVFGERYKHTCGSGALRGVLALTAAALQDEPASDEAVVKGFMWLMAFADSQGIGMGIFQGGSGVANRTLDTAIQASLEVSC